MEEFALLADLHKRNARQGPGGEAETEQALALALRACATPQRVADIGCGTGAATLLLAQRLQASITAVDFLPEFLAVLTQRAMTAGVAERITTLACPMENLPFADGEYDLIWSEGAIYNIGFARGVADWRRFLKPGGVLVVSELTWCTATRPAALAQHWQAEYPGVDVASAKLRVLEESGYAPLGYCLLPEHCWRDNYYGPLQAGFAAFLARHNHSDAARAIVAAEQREIELYATGHRYYGYGVYVAQKAA